MGFFPYGYGIIKEMRNGSDKMLEAIYNNMEGNPFILQRETSENGEGASLGKEDSQTCKQGHMLPINQMYVIIRKDQAFIRNRRTY